MSDEARTKRMIEIVNERDSLLKRLTAAEARLKWAEGMLERAKPYVEKYRRDSRRFPWHEEDSWLSDYKKGPVNEN